MMFTNCFDQLDEDDGSILTSEDLMTKFSKEKDAIKFYLQKITKADDTEVESLASIVVKDAIKTQATHTDQDNEHVWLYKIATNAAIDLIRERRK